MLLTTCVKVISTQHTDISECTKVWWEGCTGGVTRSGGATGAVALKEEWHPGVEVSSPACFLTNNTGDWDLHEVMLATDHNSVAFIILETFIEHSSILSIISLSNDHFIGHWVDIACFLKMPKSANRNQTKMLLLSLENHLTVGISAGRLQGGRRRQSTNEWIESNIIGYDQGELKRGRNWQNQNSWFKK